MYAYNKKLSRKQKMMITSVAFLLCAGLITTILYQNNLKEDVPVMKKKDELVISLPDKEMRFINPFNVEAQVVLEYFDGTDHEVKDYTVFEGIYRPNQGIDYGSNNESFDVLNMMDGKVLEVKEDPMFGKSVAIQSGDMVITYQSLDALNYQKGDEIKQGEVIAKASTNAYNPDLGNHLHVVVEKNGKLLNPKNIILKTLSEVE